ncbi:MAG TPA: metallophosphoesterase [Sphingomicrobium sp.]
MIYRSGRKRSRVKRAALVLVLFALAMLGWMYHVATSDPIVRSATVTVDGLAAPLRLVLLSDVHVAGPDMPPRRVRRIVAQINALHPDLVLLAGDFVSDKRVATRRYPAAAAIAPLAGLKARLGVVAVLGNHDHWRDAAAIRQALRSAGIAVLDNDADRIGPLTIGGVDDPFTGNDDLGTVIARMRFLPGPRILLSHSPDVFPRVPGDVALTLAGHTHCGQIRLPLIGALSTMSDYGDRYACGRVDENGRTLIVSAGVGTSLLPLRLGAAPDLWLVDLRPRS